MLLTNDKWLLSFETEACGKPPDRYQLIGLSADLYHNWQMLLPVIVIGDQPQNPDQSIPV